jgi:hypothetical protein
VSVLFELLGKLNDKAAVNEAASPTWARRCTRSTAGSTGPAGCNESYFALDPATWALGAAAADMKLSEARYARALRLAWDRKAGFPQLSDEAVAQAYPGRSQSMTQVLHGADARLSALTGEP